jgi:hypothetical protein
MPRVDALVARDCVTGNAGRVPVQNARIMSVVKAQPLAPTLNGTLL